MKPLSFLGTIFKKKIGTNFEVGIVHTIRTVCLYSPYIGTEIEAKNRKKEEFDFSCSTCKLRQKFIFRVEISWFDIFLCIAVNDKLLLKNKNNLSLTGFPLVGFSRAIGKKS